MEARQKLSFIVARMSTGQLNVSVSMENEKCHSVTNQIYCASTNYDMC